MPRTPNPAVNLAPFGRWTPLKRRRLALRYVYWRVIEKMEANQMRHHISIQR